jgi:hypothetical protein
MQFKNIYLEFKLKERDTYDNFIKNRKYIQVCKQFANDYTIVHIVIYREEYENYKVCLSFTLYKEIQRYKTDEMIDCHYYEIVSKKQQIQDAMESRALNLIIQNIIGDKMFQW